MRMNKKPNPSQLLINKVQSFLYALLRFGAIFAVMFFYLFSLTQPTTKWTIVHSHPTSAPQQESAHEHADEDDHDHHHSHQEPSPPVTAKQAEDSNTDHPHSHSLVITSAPVHSAPGQASLIPIDVPTFVFAIPNEKQPPADPHLGSIFRPPIAG